MKTIISSLMLLLPLSAFAQDATFSGKVKGEVPKGMRVYIQPIGSRQSRPDTVAFNGGRYTATCKQSPYGFYNIITVYNQRQGVTPITAANGKKADIVVSPAGCSLAKPGKDDAALAVFNDNYVSHLKDFWINGKQMSNDELLSSIGYYEKLADSVITARKPGQATAEYLRLWGALVSFETLGNLKFATGHAPSELGLDIHDKAVSLLKTVDTPMSSLFDNAPDIVLNACRGKGLTERFNEIATLVNDTQLRQAAQRKVLNRWVNNFDYQNHFDDGLKELRELVAKYGLDSKYVSDFEAKRSTIKGTPFPASAKLVTPDGKEASFAQFRGKVVYVDMWASWCVPCIKEVPHLKQLEKDFEGKNIAFVSISIDANEQAWKQKMKQLDMHGNQFINSNNSLGKALNVNAIPRFLIYGADGNLIDNNAPRPSDTRIKAMLEKLCR